MERIPITILGGSDRSAGPARGPTAGLHPLATYKGAHLRIEDRPLVAVLAERLDASRGFGPVRVAGPARIYRDACPGVEVVDTDGSVGRNLRAALDHHVRETPGPLALSACDVLPSATDLAELRAAYEESKPCALWFPLVVKPADAEELGAHAWKPSYGIRPAAGADPVRVLPGHLGIFDPEALRMPLIHRLLDSAYRARNRSIRTKRAAMVRAVLGGLLVTDLKLLLSFRAPTRTVATISAGLGIARRLRAGRLTLPDLERSIARILLRRSHRRRAPASGVRLPLISLLSLAEDIDTLEEAQAHERMEVAEE